MSEKKLNQLEAVEIVEHKLTPEEQIDFLERKLEEAKLEVTDKNIALIEMTAARNALYQFVQDTQMKLAEVQGQRDNDIEAYQKELTLRLQEKRQLQTEIDTLSIKAKRYDELQESLIKIKMDAEIRAHSVVDEAQEIALDTVTRIDKIEKEIELFSEYVVFLRRDIKIGTLTLDDRLDTLYVRLRRNLDRLTEIKRDFYKKNSLPLDEQEIGFSSGIPPVVKYEYEEVSEETAEEKAEEQAEEIKEIVEEKTE